MVSISVVAAGPAAGMRAAGLGATGVSALASGAAPGAGDGFAISPLSGATIAPARPRSETLAVAVAVVATR
jgi:hypothetical protein